MCIGEVITHAFVRARPVTSGSPSVHTKDTPVDLDMLSALYSQLVGPNEQSLQELANRIANAAGPGFYAHDVLIDAQTKKAYLAETGYKFDDRSYCKRMSNIVSALPSMKGFSNPAEVAKNTAPVFIDLLETDRNANRSAAPSSGPGQ